ncbi:MAG: hydantoinase/oxoprolinase family protein [Actinomycetota bacterium]|nr:hydantoinase/oxoprolinase family protein [Actinomycetota bacterium]
MHAAVDVGGTFTDIAVWDAGRLATGKVPTTADQSDGVVEALRQFAGQGTHLIHGTTAATNAVLQRRGARTALVTDAGFEHLIEIGRQDRPSLYDTTQVRPTPIVPADRRFGFVGRSHPEAPGPIDQEALARLCEAIAGVQPEAVAVSLLYSFAHHDRETAVATALSSKIPGVPISLSSEVVAEFREFERASTTVLNAYLIPVVASYLQRLARGAVDGGVVGAPSVMRSSGGLMSLEAAAALPASIILSGPAGGAVAAAALGTALGHRTVVSFDMGGTSTDVCRIEHGRPEVGYERAIDGLPCRMPSVAIHTVGAGGGSLAWADPGGALRVGPVSAGADPGPAAYGRGGTEPTVTDADLLLGLIGAGTRFGGSLDLHVRAAEVALARLGDGVGLDALACARGIVTVVESHMERAIRRVSVEEGADPRDAVLVAFGGAGGLHASAMARRLGMAGVVIPAHAGVFSAFGMLLAPPRADAARSVLLSPGEELDGPSRAVATAARRAMPSATEVDLVMDVRYRGQSHETSVPYRLGEGWDDLAERFHDAHRRRNGFDRPGDAIELVTIRAEATGPPAVTWGEVPHAVEPGDPGRGSRQIMTDGGEESASVWWRPSLPAGSEILGPAVVEEPEATTFIGAGERVIVHESGALEVTW